MTQRSKALTYFISLQFSNLRCFSEHQTLFLSNKDGWPAPWTLILGENGVGKTTLLNVIASMRPVPSADHKKPKESSVEPALLAETDNKAISRLVRHGDGELHIIATLNHVETLRAPPKIIRQKPVQTHITVRANDGELKEVTSTSNTKRSISEPFIITYSANRQLGKANLEDAVDSKTSGTPFPAITTLYDPEAILSTLDYARLKGNKVADRRLIKLREMLAKLLPDIEEAEDIHILGPAVTSEPSEKAGVYLQTKYGEVPFSGLSLGYQTTLAWTLDMAWRMFQRNPLADNPLAEPAVVLVDEIDLHLHPRWQQTLRGFLAEHFPAVQFVATAHSPLMAQASLDGNIVVLEAEEDHVVIHNDPERAITWRLDQIAVSLFGLEGVRHPKVQRLFTRRDYLVDKSPRSPGEEDELSKLEECIRALPVAETRRDQEAMDVIRRAAAILRGRQN